MLTTGFIVVLCLACLGLAWAWEVESEKRKDAERGHASMRSALRVVEREAFERESQLLEEVARLMKVEEARSPRTPSLPSSTPTD